MGPGYNNKKPTVVIAPVEEKKPWYDTLFKNEKPMPPDAKDFTPEQEASLDRIFAKRQASIKPLSVAPPTIDIKRPRPIQAPTQAPASIPIAPMQQPAAEEKPWYSSIFGENKPGEPSAARNAVDTGIHFLGAFGNNISGNRSGNIALNQAFAQRRQEYADRDPNSKSSILTRGMAKELGMPIKGDESAYDLKPQMPYVRDMLTARAMRGQARAGGGAPTYKAPTESQAKAKSFADRMSQSQSIIDNLEAKAIAGEDGGYHPGQFQIDRLPERAKTESRKSYEQAQRTFINAALRRESGAVISPEEAEEAAKQYFPQSGDSVELLKQKQKAREIITRNMQLEGAPAGDYESSRSPSQSIMQDKNGKKYRVANGKVVGEL